MRNRCCTVFGLAIGLFVTSLFWGAWGKPVYAAPVAPPTITGAYPAVNAGSVPITATVQVSFDQAMDASTVTSRTLVVHGELTGRHVGSIGVISQTAILTTAMPFQPNELAQVSVTNGVQNESGENLSATKVWQFRTRIGGEPGVFMPLGPGFASGDNFDSHLFVAGDVDHDGDVDAILRQIESGGSGSPISHFSFHFSRLRYRGVMIELTS